MMLPKFNLEDRDKIYFISDLHLGTPSSHESLMREKKVVKWLREKEPNMKALFLMGDIFDFWFTYRFVIPKGFIRIQGELARLADKGIPIYWFTGNHDMWIFDYFEKEINIKRIDQPTQLFVNNFKLYLGHGDGLGPGDLFYKFLKKIFKNSFFQFLFQVTPPVIGMGIAHLWSKKSRASGDKKEKFLGKDEWLYIYAKKIEANEHHDYYIFGHRHLPLDIAINENSKYINLGEWLHSFSYGELSKEGFYLKYFN